MKNLEKKEEWHLLCNRFKLIQGDITEINIILTPYNANKIREIAFWGNSASLEIGSSKNSLNDVYLHVTLTGYAKYNS